MKKKHGDCDAIAGIVVVLGEKKEKDSDALVTAAAIHAICST